jgi:hypothetical protein
MDLFLILFLVGFGGLALMAFSGLGRHHAGGAPHGGHASHVGHGGPHGAHVHHAGGGHRGGHTSGGGVRGALLSWLSPRVLFAAALGAGAAGLLARPLFGSFLAGLFAMGGAVVFELLLARPLFQLADKFVSRPALTIESALYDEAEAVTGFNSAGEGMIRLTMDGQVRQLLGILAPDERAAGVKVRAGERVRVEDVDAARNRCVVSRRAIEA